MSFTKEKFLKLSKDNKIKKIIFAIREYLQDFKVEFYPIELLNWLNEVESFNFLIPSSNYDWGILLSKLLQILHEENQFTEEIPFDNPQKERIILPIKVILSDIRSPFNVGSIIRTAEAFCVEELISCGITPNFDNPKVSKTSKNSNLPFRYFKNTLEAIKILKEECYSIVSLEKTSNSISLNDININQKMAIIVGNEEFGISKEILTLSDYIVHIPMFGTKNSINVSVATGIMLYQMSRKFISSNFGC